MTDILKKLCGWWCAFTNSKSLFPSLSDKEKAELVRMASGGDPETQDYYARVLDKLMQEKRKHTWNWSAFLFNYAWTAYHKMTAEFYIGGLLGATIRILFNMIALLALLPIPFWPILTVVGLVFFGRYGNTLLFLAAERKIRAGYASLPKYKGLNDLIVYGVVGTWLLSRLCTLMALSRFHILSRATFIAVIKGMNGFFMLCLVTLFLLPAIMALYNKMQLRKHVK